MKKYFFFLFFFISFSNAELPVYQYNLADYYTGSSSSDDFQSFSCPAGQELVKSQEILNQYIGSVQKSYYSAVNVVTPTWYSISQKQIRFAFVTENSTSWYKMQHIFVYSCQAKTCPSGSSWDVVSQSCVSSCPAGQEYYSGQCTDICKPNQRRDEINGGYAYECIDMCPSLDTYEPLTGIDMIDSLAGGLFPFDPSFCKTPPTVDEPTCNSKKDEGYAWVCPEENWMSMLFGYLTGGSTHDECYCGNVNKSYPPGVPFVGGSKTGAKPRTTEPTSTPSRNNPLLDDFMGLADDYEDMLADYAEYLRRNGYGDPDNPTNPYGKNYDYTDTRLEYDPVTGKETFVPEFTETPNANGSTTLSSNGYTNTMTSTGVKVEPYIPPNTSVTPNTSPTLQPTAVTAEAFNAGWQTATKSKWNLPETSPAGPLVTYETVPSNLTGTSTQVIPYTWNVVPTANGATYTSTNNGTTTTVNTSNDGENTRYTVTTSTPWGGGYTNTTGYTYTVNNSTGTVTSPNPSTGTTTTPSGTTYTNTGTTYNYNSSTQNMDELLNFKPVVSDTAMTKPFDEMVKAQNDALDFIDSLKNSINGIKLDFDAMMLKLKNPPQIHEKTGNCNLTAVFLGKTIVANPCNAFYPYREMLKLFFIAFGSFFVARFAVENLK